MHTLLKIPSILRHLVLIYAKLIVTFSDSDKSELYEYTNYDHPSKLLSCIIRAQSADMFSNFF